MTEDLFRERLVELFNEFHKENSSSYVTHTAMKVAYDWKSLCDLDDCIDKVRSYHAFCDGGYFVIDVYFHNNESGFPVARVSEDKTVEWTNPMYKNCPKVMKVIKEIIES